MRISQCFERSEWAAGCLAHEVEAREVSEGSRWSIAKDQPNPVSVSGETARLNDRGLVRRNPSRPAVTRDCINRPDTRLHSTAAARAIPTRPNAGAIHTHAKLERTRNSPLSGLGAPTLLTNQDQVDPPHYHGNAIQNVTCGQTKRRLYQAATSRTFSEPQKRWGNKCGDEG